MYVRDDLHLSGLGKVRYLNLVGRGVCRKRLYVDKRRGYQRIRRNTS